MRGEKLSAFETATERSDHLFEKLDTNRDDVITEDEFMEAAKADPKLVSHLTETKLLGPVEEW